MARMWLSEADAAGQVTKEVEAEVDAPVEAELLEPSWLSPWAMERTRLKASGPATMVASWCRSLTRAW